MQSLKGSLGAFGSGAGFFEVAGVGVGVRGDGERERGGFGAFGCEKREFAVHGGRIVLDKGEDVGRAMNVGDVEFFGEGVIERSLGFVEAAQAKVGAGEGDVGDAVAWVE